MLGRASTDLTPDYRVADGTAGAPKLDWVGLKWDTIGNAFVETAIGATSLLPIDTALASTPFRAQPIAAAPTGRGDYTWARLTALAGLLPGASRLGDELALLWTADQVAESAYATRLDAVWNGAAFVG